MTAMKTKQETLDWLMKSLGAFTTFAVIWVVLDLLADVVNPFGLLSFLAGISFLSALVALFGILVGAGAFLRR